jgi:malonyl-CoA O-methyltransferase
MAERLEWIKFDVRHGLLWQGLHGGGQRALAARYPQAQWHAVEDVAEPWLRARKRFWQRPHWLHPDAVPAGQAQLVWASQLLHALPDLRAALAAWHQALAVDGFLMFSSFGPDTFIELRRVYAQQGFGELAPLWVDLHDIGDLLVETGFAEPVMDQERLSLTWRDPDTLWRDLSQLGGNLHRNRFAGLRTPAWRKRWNQAMEGLRGSDGLLRLSLEFVCGHAIKPAPRLRVEPETRVTVDQMRAHLRERRS